jgi:very-short-patch-repair endonuclease/DNA polymerase III delta prime subunit
LFVDDTTGSSASHLSNLERLRSRLLDLSARNRLLNFSHTRSKRFVRVIDELPDQLFEMLISERSMRFAAIPEPTEKLLLEHGFLEKDRCTGQLREIRKLPTAEEWAAVLGMASSYELPIPMRVQVSIEEPSVVGEEVSTLEDIRERKHSDESIQSLYFPPELEARLHILHAQSRLALEESGANILYLAIGFLEWDESVAGTNSTRLAPLMLVPVQLDKGRLNEATATFEYRIQHTGEDILTNLSLQEKLQLDFGIALPSITEDLTPEAYFRLVQDTILRAKPTWQVRRFASLGLFEFGKLMMYLDLDPERWSEGQLGGHPLVQRLTGAKVENNEAPLESGFSAEYRIDELPEVHERYPLIDDADSSQHSALVDVIRGENLVIEGPPGTGKSQTITNLIAAAMAQGKRVLFVAEKRAALEVVKNRLERAGLGDFCLELHSHKSQKQAVISSIRQRLQKRGTFRAPKARQEQIGHYERLKEQLNRYVEQLHQEQGQTGMTVHQILMQATRLREALPLAPSELHPAFERPIARAQLEEQANFYATYYRKTAQEAGVPGRLETHPWFGCRLTRLTGPERELLMTSLSNAQQALAQFADVRRSLAELMGASEIERFTPQALAELAERLPSLNLPQGDEDWSLLASLDETTCTALEAWLNRFDTLLQGQEALARSFKPDAIQSPEICTLLSRACAALRLHAEGDLDLSRALELMKQTRDLMQAAAQVNTVIQHLQEQGAATKLLADREGLEQLGTLLLLAQALPSELIKARQKSYEDEALDILLSKLSSLLPELRQQREYLSKIFSFERLPNSQRLEDLHRVLSDSSLLRWFKSEWRTAKAELLTLVRPGVKLGEGIEALTTAIAFQRESKALETNANYAQKLGLLYQGLETEVNDLLRLRGWYRQVRETCGRGFGANVWIADYLTQAEAEDVCRLRDDADRLLVYLGEVEDLRQALETLFNFDAHDLRTQPLLTPEGQFMRLLKSVGGALKAMLPHVREQNPTLLGLQEKIKALETWQQSVTQLRQDEQLTKALDSRELPTLEQASSARATLNAWRHTVELAKPLLALSIGTSLAGRLVSVDANEAPALITRWQRYSATIQQAMAAWEDRLDAFLVQGEIEPEEWWQVLVEHTFEALQDRLQRAAGREDLLDHWFEYRRLRSRLVDLGFESTVVAIERQRLEAERCSEACLLGLLDYWACEILEDNPSLGQFSGKEQDAIRARFAEIDQALKHIQREEVAYDIDQIKVPAGNNSGKVKERTELALLEHEASKQRSHQPIRSLMQRAVNALQALKPCFMMSPMAVAQYLPAGEVEFDLVVMDEASQMRPEESLGSIARGRQLVVVGDPKQLPPTNFFARQGTGDELEDEDLSLAQDSESILDAAMPLFRLRRLRWHYRSRHESLIAFSNSAFYDGNLVVYPSPHRESPEFGIKFKHIENGRFVEQRNVEEAEAVVMAIENHLLTHPDESLGVVAMNVKQSEQIERLLELRAKQNPELQRAWERNAGLAEPLFIKNLENVQGDERDVIFISFTYGPMEAGGKVPQRFGPVNSDSGWRRLNVLFTRSKKRMHIFTSFIASDVLVTGTSSRGVHALRNFLQFAETGYLPRIEETDRAPDSDFEIAVMDALSRHGYTCEPQVGVAGFFIDLAVRDPDQPGRYLMGIECDGAAYHSGKSARDRDRLRQSVLEQLGWRIRRIWSVDWFRNPRTQLDPIVQELARLREGDLTNESEQASQKKELPRPGEPIVYYPSEQ